MRGFSRRRTIYVLMFVMAATAAFALVTLRARQYGCVSFEPGIRGEVMRSDSGETLYFNGSCWTRQPVPPTDTPA